MQNIHYIQDFDNKPDKEGLQSSEQPPATLLETFKRIFFPRFAVKTITMLLIATNIAIYVTLLIVSLVVSTSYPCILYMLGALYPPDLLRFQFYRLIIPTFLHFDFSHIIMNSLSLMFLGFEIEYGLGNAAFLILYFGSALYGYMFSAAGYYSTLTAGASASILGLFGLYIVSMAFKIRKLDLRSYGVFAFLILFNMVLFLNPQNGNIFAHLGGLIFGMLFSLVQDPPTAQDVPTIEK